MCLPRPPPAGLGAHPVQRAGGHESQGTPEPVAARHPLPQRQELLQVRGRHLDQEHRLGGDEDPVRRHHELPHGPQAVPHGPPDVLTRHTGMSNRIEVGTIHSAKTN